MDFKAVLSLLLEKFDENNVNYALMGGFALGLCGVGRTTVDIDFLISQDDVKQIEKIMTDIESLLNIYGPGLDRPLLKQYFYLFDMQDLYKKLIEEKTK